MDLSADNYKSDEQHQSHPFLDMVQLFRVFISRLVSFFAVTEEEQLKAGIIFGTKGRD